jgi:hypothetical protein
MLRVQEYRQEEWPAEQWLMDHGQAEPMVGMHPFSRLAVRHGTTRAAAPKWELSPTAWYSKAVKKTGVCERRGLGSHRNLETAALWCATASPVLS